MSKETFHMPKETYHIPKRDLPTLVCMRVTRRSEFDTMYIGICIIHKITTHTQPDRDTRTQHTCIYTIYECLSVTRGYRVVDVSNQTYQRDLCYIKRDLIYTKRDLLTLAYLRVTRGYRVVNAGLQHLVISLGFGGESEY
jgi:hypothetical protein